MENTARLTPLADGWSVKEDVTEPDKNEFTVRRMFYADEIRAFAVQNHALLKADLYKKDSAYRTSPVLFFVTHNQSVRVYSNDGTGEILIYSFGYNGRRYVGTESGGAIHAVRLPAIYGERIMITVQISPSFSSEHLNFDRWYYGKIKTSVPKFYMGWGSQILHQVFETSWYQWVPVLFVLLMSIMAFIYYAAFLIHNHKCIWRYLFLGIFAFLVAMCLFFDSYIGVYLCRNSFTVCLLSTLLISLHPYSIVVFMQDRRNLARTDKIPRVLKGVSMADVVLVCVCSAVHVIPFTLVRMYVSLVLMATCALVLLIILHEIIAEKGNADFYDILMIFVSVSLLIDFVILFMRPSSVEAFRISRWSLVLFFGVMVVQTTKEFFDGEIAIAKSEVFFQTSNTDIVTGCRVGTLIWLEQRILKPQSDYAFLVIMLPGFLNALKVYGEEECKGILRLVSQSLQKFFPVSNIYRMSGSKFGVYVEVEQYPLLDGILGNIAKDIDDFNAMNAEYKIDLLSCYGIYDEKKDRDFDGFYIRLLWDLRKKYYDIYKAPADTRDLP